MQKEIRKEIESLPDERFTNTEQEAWIEYFVSKYEVDPFEINEDVLNLCQKDLIRRWESRQ